MIQASKVSDMALCASEGAQHLMQLSSVLMEFADTNNNSSVKSYLIERIHIHLRYSRKKIIKSH